MTQILDSADLLHLSHEGDNFLADSYSEFHKIASVVQS